MFARKFKNPPERNDNRLLKDQVEHEKVNKEILFLIVHAIEFLAKQGLPFRGNGEETLDFASETVDGQF